MATFNTSDLKKGVKVQLDGDPYIMVECNFVKPGKGQAMYKCKLKHLLKGTTIDRTWKSGESIESADVTEIESQFLYRQGDTFVFMDNESFEQYELSIDQVGDTWKFLQDAMTCNMVLFNNNPITVTPPNHAVLKIDYCEPAVRGNTATGLTKPVKLETGAEILCPAFVEMGELVRVDTRTGEYIERVKE